MYHFDFQPRKRPCKTRGSTAESRAGRLSGKEYSQQRFLYRTRPWWKSLVDWFVVVTCRVNYSNEGRRKECSLGVPAPRSKFQKSTFPSSLLSSHAITSSLTRTSETPTPTRWTPQGRKTRMRRARARAISSRISPSSLQRNKMSPAKQ